jgi:hypothetical protein
MPSKDCNNILGTYIVPPKTLLAYQYINGKNIPVQDQTVWVINEYNKGYFFGKAYVALNGQPLSESNLSGTVTPQGDVYITFFSVDGSTKITGIGKFVTKPRSDKKESNKRFFLMQMNSAQNSTLGLSHWSYMVPVTAKDEWYQHLPSVGLSVPQFISVSNFDQKVSS